MFEGKHGNKFYFPTAHLSKLIAHNSLISWSYSSSLSCTAPCCCTPKCTARSPLPAGPAQPSTIISNGSSFGFLPDSPRHSWEIPTRASQLPSLTATTELLVCLPLPPRARPPRRESMCLFFRFPIA